MSKSSEVNFDHTYSLNKSFYFSAKGDSLQIVNIAEDDNFFLKVDGACKTVFEMIVKQKKPSEVLSFLLSQPNAEPKDQTEEFIKTYLADLLEMGILEG